MRDYSNHWDEFSKYYRDHPAGQYLGDEWGAIDDVRDEYLKPYLMAGMRVLEIGPGGGRYTTELIKAVGLERVEVADCSQEMIDRCLGRFGINLRAYKTDGKTLDTVKPSAPYNFVFSYDVFCHIDLYDISQLLKQLTTLVDKEAVMVVHHSDVSRTFGLEHWIGLRQMFKGEDSAGSFSVNSAEMMRTVLRYNGWRVVKQSPARNGRDTVTVAKR
jgi:trans-aconitate methyltransferase